MSHHYTTKALGRAWVPSPIQSPGRISSQGRLNPWPANTNTNSTTSNRPRQHAAVEEPWHHSLRILRGRPIERLAVLLALLVFTAFLAYHHDRFHFVDSAAHHVWNYSRNGLRLAGSRGGSLIPTWSRVNWSEFAYISYATTPDDVCNSLMLAESLHRLGAKPDTVILYTEDLVRSSSPSSTLLLQQAIALYGAHVKPVPGLSTSTKEGVGETKEEDNTVWPQHLTKLLAFNQTRYKRVLYLDSDATLLKPMDDLFLLPASAPVAVPRAYWLVDTLSTSIMLASPSAENFERITARVSEGHEGEDGEDIINALYGDSRLLIPHKPYLLLTGEMRRDDHAAYLGSAEEEWDVKKVMDEARYVRFSDWPTPDEAMKEQGPPKCKVTGGKGAAGGTSCEDRNVWLELHEDFRERRKVSDVLLGDTQVRWLPWKTMLSTLFVVCNADCD